MHVGPEKLVLDAGSLGLVEYRGQVYSRQEAARLVSSRLFHLSWLGEVLVLTLKEEKGLQLTWGREGHVRVLVSYT